MTAAVARRTTTPARRVQQPTTRPRSQSVGPAPARKHQTTRKHHRNRPGLVEVGALRRRARRRAGVLGLAVFCAVSLFAIALVQAQLVTGQRDLDQLRSQIVDAREQRALLAGEVETASSPEAIVNRARQELGMVRSIEPVYLVPVSPVPQPERPLFEPPPARADHDIMAVGAVMNSLEGQSAGSGHSLAGSRATTAGVGTG